MEQRLSLNVCSSSKGQLLFAKPQLQIRQYPISVFKKYSLLNLFLSGMETFLKFQNIFLQGSSYLCCHKINVPLINTHIPLGRLLLYNHLNYLTQFPF